MRGVWHHQDRRRRGPRELTGIADHWREGSSHGPLEWTWCRAGLAPCTRTGWPGAEKTCAPGANRDARSPSRDSKNAIAYEPGNCPRATLGYRTPQKHSTNSLLPPIDTAGYALVDRLFAYPHARNLSTCEHASALPGIGGTSTPRTRGYSIVAPGPSGGRGPSISTGMRSSAPPGCLA